MVRRQTYRHGMREGAQSFPSHLDPSDDTPGGGSEVKGSGSLKVNEITTNYDNTQIYEP